MEQAHISIPLSFPFYLNFSCLCLLLSPELHGTNDPGLCLHDTFSKLTRIGPGLAVFV